MRYQVTRIVAVESSSRVYDFTLSLDQFVSYIPFPSKQKIATSYCLVWMALDNRHILKKLKLHMHRRGFVKQTCFSRKNS